ncbi:hypothetical protein [Terriglobus sp. RCC_193]|uniref:hypothetical protein n=1 Tax=Terriglobus sp. RCC_193 TaxID=3239218 RepID=UPI003525524E
MRASLRWFTLMIFTLLPHVAGAQSLCPWLNQATASGALGVDVTMHVTLLPQSPHLARLPQSSYPVSDPRPNGMCEFTTHDQRSTLRIKVATMTHPKKEYAAAIRSSCPGTSRSLIGVGNQAIACSSPSNGGTEDRVVAYVRNRLMVLRCSHPPMESVHWQGSDVTSDAVVQAIAEQIAGSMY